MKFKDPLEQYLWRWYKEENNTEETTEISGVIIKISDNDSFNKIIFIFTTSTTPEIYKWWTHDFEGNKRDNLLEEYKPTQAEKRLAIGAVFSLADLILKA